MSIREKKGAKTAVAGVNSVLLVGVRDAKLYISKGRSDTVSMWLQLESSMMSLLAPLMILSHSHCEIRMIASIKFTELSHIPGWISWQEGDGPAGQTLTASDSAVSFCQMFPLIPIYQHFQSSSSFSTRPHY